jgi:23S rRNA pseudouridine1911/1915/1917 synthase
MEGGNVINILYEDNHILVVEKPINMPTCLDSSNDLDLLTKLKEYIKNKYDKKGNVYLGLVHRLDRPVGGVMVFAKTSKAASRLSESIRTNSINKKYYAVVIGKVNSHGIYKDKLLKDPKTNTTKVDLKGKESILEYDLIDYKNDLSLVDIKLKTGRSHQIRVQFSYHGNPLYGDQRYNKKAKVKEQIALFCYSLEFIHPTTKELMKFNLDLPNRYPFNLFEVH